MEKGSLGVGGGGSGVNGDGGSGNEVGDGCAEGGEEGKIDKEGEKGCCGRNE